MNKLPGINWDRFTGLANTRPSVDPEAQRRRGEMLTKIVQSIMAENPNDSDMEWNVYQRSGEIAEENGLPLDISADDVHQHYLQMYEGE